jgi:hypothetical protein
MDTRYRITFSTTSVLLHLLGYSSEPSSISIFGRLTVTDTNICLATLDQFNGESV